MDFFKMKKNDKLILICCFTLILIAALILYHNPLLSNKPLGLDALGHISKISYLKEFGLNVKWDLAWYNGAPFLAYYSPLYYQMGYFFNNIIFGSNFLSFLSILLTAIGIFLLLNYYTKNKTYATIFALFFLSVLSTSYYYISVGNHPYVFGLFTIPFTLLFLEKSLVNKRYNFLLYSLFFILAYLTHIFIALAIFLLVSLRIIIFCYFNQRNKLLKRVVISGSIYLSIPLLISCFWFLPFLSKSKSFIGDGIGYLPSLNHILGFGDYTIWGKAAGEIGIIFWLFIISLLLIKEALKEKDEKILFWGLVSILFFLLLKGILGNYYPTGVGAIRFILPFSILICIFSGIVFAKRFGSNKKIIGVLVFLLILALSFNYNTINENYSKYSYNSDLDRYGIIKEVYSLEEFPINNSFSNYRFGTSRYIFSETLNYKFPWQDQTYGYFDQGALYPDQLNSFKESVWHSNDLNATIKYLDNYAIKYFEIGGQDLLFDNKFSESKDFTLIMKKNFSDYPFKIYEYKNAKPIISIILNNIYENLSDYKVIRKSPDSVYVTYRFSGVESILFKESFHKSWKARDLKSNNNIKISKNPEGFMTLNPKEGSNEIIIYQTKTNNQKIGILISILGVVLALFYSLRKKSQNKLS